MLKNVDIIGKLTNYPDVSSELMESIILNEMAIASFLEIETELLSRFNEWYIDDDEMDDKISFHESMNSTLEHVLMYENLIEQLLKKMIYLGVNE